MRALPQTFRAEAEAAAGTVVVDPARWGEPERERPELVRVLQRATVRRRRVRLAYEGRRRERSERLVDPWGLVDKDDVWYLLAGTERGQRTFRVDRIAAAEVTEEEFERPGDFELARAWEGVVEEMERRRSTVSATVLVPARFLPIVRDHFGRHCEVLGAAEDGRVRARVAAPMALTIAEQLAGWGARVEVVEPESVRAELARIGAELVGRYRT
ncbi:helix-turn-helix transcriptional regulator [Nonomuraea antimicrobica]